MKIKEAVLLFYLMIAAPAYAYGGSIIIDGTDANEHGSALNNMNQDGWLYMQRALEALAARVPQGGERRVVALTTRQGQARSAIESAFYLSSLKLSPGSSHWNLKLFDSKEEMASWLENISPDNTDILYIPTFGLTEGDLTQDEMDTINQYAEEIARFCNGSEGQGGGGALFAMGETGNGAWGWLSAVLPEITFTDFGEDGIDTSIKLTPSGEDALPGLSDAELAHAKPWHNSFKGNFTGLQILGMAPVSNPGPLVENVIIGDKVTLANLSIEHTTSAGPISAGSNISYFITVTNNGPNIALMVEVTVNLDQSITLISCEPPEACSGSNNTLTSMLGSILPGASKSLIIHGRVNCSVAAGSALATSAIVKSITPDLVPNDNLSIRETGIAAPTTVILDKPALDFGTLSAHVKSCKKPATRSFTIKNTGSCPVLISFDSLARIGRDVDSGKILNPNSGDCSKNDSPATPGDCKFFTLTAQAEPDKKLNIGSYTVILDDEVREQKYNVTFCPVVPAFINQTTRVPSNLVLPEEFTSALIFSVNRSAPQLINLNSRILPTVRLINPADPGSSPIVTLTRSGEEYTVECTIYDSRLEDIKNVKYEFLKGNGIIRTFNVAVEGAISALARNGELIRGKSFKIKQKFLVPKEKKATAIRVTITGGNSSAGPVSVSISTAALRPAGARQIATVELKPLRISSTRRNRSSHKRNP